MAYKQLHLFIFSVLFILLSGFYIYKIKVREGMTTGTNNSSVGAMRCPNVLIQKGTKYFLHNTELVEVPGVNPIEFNALDEYVQFLEWQRGAGIRCPVLFLQHTYDAQGNAAYKVRPSVTEMQGGLPPQMDVPGFPGYDASSAPLGETNTNMSTLDAMNPNWKGPQI